MEKLKFSEVFAILVTVVVNFFKKSLEILLEINLQFGVTDFAYKKRMCTYNKLVFPICKRKTVSLRRATLKRSNRHVNIEKLREASMDRNQPQGCHIYPYEH